MALGPEELFGSATSQKPNLRVRPYEGGIRVGTLAAISGAPELPNLTPLAWDAGNSLWAVFDDSVTEEVYTITADGTPATAGDFTLSIDGETTAAIAFDADAAAVQAALEALSNVASGDVAAADSVATDLGDANHVVTLTFGGAYSGMAVTVTVAWNLTGNDHVLANTANGSGSATNQVDGLLWQPDSEAHASDATNETQIQVLKRGEVHHDDIPLPTTSSQTQGGLDTALLSQDLRKLGLDITGQASTP